MNGKYYARNEVERNFDKDIRTVVLADGSEVEKALFVQNQVILSTLRRIEDRLGISDQETVTGKQEA